MTLVILLLKMVVKHFLLKKGVKLVLEDALIKCPNQRFNVDLKTNDLRIVDQFIKLLEGKRLKGECCASFHLDNLKAVRNLAPDILTSVTTKKLFLF